jgi:type II secretory pathway component GspD/PulD (secretin)
MKYFKLNAVILAGALGLALNAAAQPAEDSGNPPPDAAPPQNEIPDETAAAAAALAQAATEASSATATNVQTNTDTEKDTAQTGDNTSNEPQSFIRQGTTPPRYVAPMRGTNAGESAFDLNTLPTTNTPPDQVVKDGEKGLRLNFRGARLETVLDYLSDAAGFIIVPETDVRGRVDVWSNQPLTKDEAVEVLGKVLAKEGYAVIRDGRTLTIMTQDMAKKSDIPVKVSYKASDIPKDQQVVTQIIPVRFINAVQLAKDLQPLMPTQTTMTANEGGNALVITDTQQNIRRLVEIINALDTTVSSLSSVRVFALRYADAKTVADMVKEVFASSDSSNSSSGRAGGRGQFRFGGAGGMFGMGGGADTGTTSSTGRPGAARVVATSDERSNSLVVSAPDDLMATIEQLVKSVDTNVDDLTEIRVFNLKNADPQETSDLLASLFPDPSSSQDQQNGFRGIFRGGPFGGNTASDTSSQSDRMKKQSKVIAVPDKRTSSVVVTAAHDTMDQIAKMIAQLDASSARKQKVFVYTVDNTDPTIVQQTLQGLFSGQGTSASSSRTTSGQTGTQLSNRSQQNQNSSRTGTSSGFGSSSSGTRTSSSGN